MGLLLKYLAEVESLMPAKRELPAAAKRILSKDAHARANPKAGVDVSHMPDEEFANLIDARSK